MLVSTHEDIVRQGPEEIKKWRKKNPNTQLSLINSELSNLDLSGADLSGAFIFRTYLKNTKLVGANLQKININYSDCSKADFSKADMSGGIIYFCNFINTLFSSAILSRTEMMNNHFAHNIFNSADLNKTKIMNCQFLLCNFSEAKFIESKIDLTDIYTSNLSHTNFSKSHLQITTFCSSELNETDLSYAKLAGVSFMFCNLSQIKGLETTIHLKPSSIDFSTISKSFFNSGNKLSKELKNFLINTGIPVELVNKLPKIISTVKYHSCFISYGSPDLVFATELVNNLRARGVSCWLYDLDSTVGKRTWAEITSKRREAEKMIMLCSIKALMREGVKKEIESQIDEDPNKLIPISLDDDWKHDGFEIKRCDNSLKPFLLDRNYADFTKKDYNSQIEKLLKCLTIID